MLRRSVSATELSAAIHSGRTRHLNERQSSPGMRPDASQSSIAHGKDKQPGSRVQRYIYRLQRASGYTRCRLILVILVAYDGLLLFWE